MDNEKFPRQEGQLEALEHLLENDGFTPEDLVEPQAPYEGRFAAKEAPEPAPEETPEIPVEEVPVEEIPAEEAQESPAAAEAVPTEEIPSEEAPVEEAPVEEAPVEEIPAENIPQEENPQLPSENVPEVPAYTQDIPVETPMGDELAGLSELLAKEEAPQEQASEISPEQEYRDDAAPPQEPAEDPVVLPRRRPIRKGRPKRKKGEGFFGIPNLLVTLVWLGITVMIGVTLGRMIWVCASDVLAFGRDDRAVTVTIYETDTIDDIAEKLHNADLVRYPGLFKFYASLAVDEGEIHPGIWDLNTRYDYHALVSMMSPSSSRDVIEVMIPEGYTSAQIFNLLQEKKVSTAVDLGRYAADGELGDYWFLENVERGNDYCLEGFLFPDTYQFYKNESPENVFKKLLDNFDKRFDEDMRSQIDELNEHLTALMRKGGKSQEFIDANQFDIRDIVIVASLIEKETSSAEEGHTIASVIYNRLFNWGSNPAYLNIDATIVYALGGKTDLTQDDLKIGSPYNTYTNTGLTPGPIANPGLASLKAALDPDSTNYYYYVLDPATGSHKFTTNYDEHQAVIASLGD